MRHVMTGLIPTPGLMTVSATGPMSDAFSLRYSTKYFDAETGLYYYGRRFYSPALMRWTTRDPIEEKGGVNLYAFCGNDAVGRYDAIGEKVVVINHMLDVRPKTGWVSPEAVAETDYKMQEYKVKDICSSNGRLRFSVEIIPDVLVVHIYRRTINKFSPIVNHLLMHAVRLLEDDHVNIARRLDSAFHGFKSEVEHIDDLPSIARRRLQEKEKSLNQSVQRLLYINSQFDRPGGPHDLSY